MPRKARRIEIPEDRPLTTEELEKCVRKAYNSAAWYATEMGKNEKEIRNKLILKGLPEEGVEVEYGTPEQSDIQVVDIISQTIDTIKNERTLSEDDLVRQTWDLMVYDGKPVNTIVNKLRMRGFDRESIEKEKERRDEERDDVFVDARLRRKAEIFVRGVSFQSLEPRKQKEKFVRKFASQGYPFSQLNELFEELVEEIHMEEDLEEELWD